MPARTRIPSRTTTLLAVAAAHGLLLWLFWRAPAPLQEAAETITSTLLWFPVTTRHASAPSSAAPQTASRANPSPQAAAPLPAPAAAETAGTATIAPSPAAPAAEVDWSTQLAGAAESALTKERQARVQAGALTRKFVIEADPLNPGRKAGPGIRWYDAGIHRIDTRGPLPVLHLNDRCVLLLFILPTCAIGHIEIHGDLFQNMRTYLDESEATAGPNYVP